MGKMWHEFKNFAAGGNMIDLAIGFIIGGAFATVVESLATDVIGDFIAALGGAPDLSGWTVGVRDGDAHIGKFVGSVISFVIMAIVLFGMVRLLKKGGIGNFRAQGQRECPYCREFVAVDAVRCRHCTSKLRAYIDEDEGAEERLES